MQRVDVNLSSHILITDGNTAQLLQKTRGGCYTRIPIKFKDNDTKCSPMLQELLHAMQSAEAHMFKWLATLCKGN